ncbi:vesicle coat protein [Leptodontidium sp. MPI-SDFR-AT-0119]|nr:vesicle coat protein [Leptodontidium sp. MPI-SDFR-AT-0119]
MATILCLAHYCDTHGPISLLCCEPIPVGCSLCFEDGSMSTRRPSSSRSLNPADSLASITRPSIRTNSNSSDVPRVSGDFTVLQNPSSAIETPPESPRVVALQGAQGGSSRRDSSFRKTYDENDKKRAIPCENCALTLPKQTKESPATNKIDNNGPILRTRKPYERINAPSPPKTDSSNSSTSSDSEIAISSKPSHRRNRSRTLVRVGTSSSNSSSFSTNSHNHFVDYTSTHEPLSSASFSIIRQSCLRTLSCETLPPSSTQSTSSPTSPFINNPFSSGPSSATSTSGGPIFFGDPQAGYTTAYIFRIPDPNARGRRRVYALMALSTHRERAAMQSFSFLSDAFRKTAAWIQGLAEAELERSESVNSPRFSNSDERSGNSNNSTPTSAFLSGRNRGPDGKFAGMSLRARGLAELVGMPDFFFELHKLFVKLLVEMDVTLGL